QRLTTSHAPVLLVNSRFSLVSAAQRALTPKAPLLPELRGHFAEFLNHDTLERLGILYLITCVGLVHGLPYSSRRTVPRQSTITHLRPYGIPITSHPKTPALPGIGLHA